MHPYYQKINLELSFDDWRFLNYLAYTYSDKVNPYMYNGQEIHSFKDFFLRSADANYNDNNLFQKIADVFIEGCEYNSSEWVYNHSQISVEIGRAHV